MCTPEHGSITRALASARRRPGAQRNGASRPAKAWGSALQRSPRSGSALPAGWPHGAGARMPQRQASRPRHDPARCSCSSSLACESVAGLGEQGNCQAVVPCARGGRPAARAISSAVKRQGGCSSAGRAQPGSPPLASTQSSATCGTSAGRRAAPGAAPGGAAPSHVR